MSIKTSIILCTYNEAPIIEETINEIFKHIKNVEIILIDDNSSDGTFEKVKNINNSNLKIFSRKSRGLASALLLGLINSSGNIVGWIDSNMPSLVKKIPEMINRLNTEDIVVLSRYVSGGSDERSKLRILSSQIINLFCRIILTSKIRDYTSGIFVMRRNVLIEVVPISYGHGEFFIEFLYNAKKKGLNILELPFTQPPDYKGLSKSAPNLIRFFKLGLIYCIRILSTIIRRS